MLKPLQLGSLKLPTNLIQGPLAGYSCAPYRWLIEQFGGVAYTTTEMISAYELAHHVAQPKRYLARYPDEKKVCYQISGDDPQVLSRAVEAVVKAGADLVDLNCGCPQRKIRKKGHGSKLLSDPEQLFRLLSAMRQASPITMSAKIRVDGDSGESFNSEVVSAIESAGMDFMVVHGRHWRERYDTPVRLDDIASVVAMASIPVIANGDACSADSVRHILQHTQAAGVMICRASMGRPWVFAEIEAQFQGRDFIIPTQSERGRWFVLHVNKLAELDSEQSALLQSRGLIKYYFGDSLKTPEFSHLADFNDYFLKIDLDSQ